METNMTTTTAEEARYLESLSTAQMKSVLTSLQGASRDLAEYLAGRRTLEDAEVPRWSEREAVDLDPETAKVWNALQEGRRRDDPTDSGRLLSVRWIRDAIESPPPEPPVLIDGMMREGELIALGAPRGIGKSWLVGNAGVLGAQGEGFLGGALRIARPFRTLIAQGEVDGWESSRRWQMLTGGSEPPEGVGESFDRWRVRTVRKRSSNSGSADKDHWSESDEWIDAILDGRLEATIEEYHFDVVVIDPWATYYAGAENSNDETEAALDKLRDLSMRRAVAIWIIHHLGKSNEARDPEDLWRGASRLADWASTRITLLPHYTEKQAEAQGMTRQQSRRYVDVKFLRRSTPTDDFSMVLDGETGWWSKWMAPEQAADARRIHLDVPDLVDALKASGGSWRSKVAAAEALGIARDTAAKLLATATRAGAIETTAGAHGATIYYLPGAHLGDEL
jgi:hypothetical protein